MELEGGKKLRALRKACKETMEHIALDAGVTYKTLFEIETGRTRQPSRETLQKILDALDQYKEISTKDRQFIFEMYGYKKPTPLPTTAEIEFAREHWRKVYSHIPYPAYLVDCSQRLLDWNKYSVRLLGIRQGDFQLKRFEDVTIFDVTFKLASSLNVEIVNQDRYLFDLVRTMKVELQPYKNEDWYARCINNATQKYPKFKALWDSTLGNGSQLSGMGNVEPIILRVPQEGVLKFQLSRIDFPSDPRFYVVQWIPVDEITIVKCLSWKHDIGN